MIASRFFWSVLSSAAVLIAICSQVAHAQCTPTYTPNTFQTPIPLSFSGNSATPVNDVRMCPSAFNTYVNNYFSITVPAVAGRFDAVLTFSNSDGNLDLSVINSTGHDIGFSNSVANNQEVVTLPNLVAGTYSVLVYALGQNIVAAGVTYSLSVTRCTQTYVPNTIGTPIQLVFSGNSATPVNGVTMCAIGQQVNNYFSIAVPAVAGRFDAVLTFTASAGNLDLAVYDSAGTSIGFSNSLSNSVEVVTIPNLASGTYSVLVYGNSIAYAGVMYTLSVTRCTQSYAPNTLTTPIALQFNGSSATPVNGATICPIGQQVNNYFSITLPEMTPAFTSALSFSASFGNLDLAIYTNLGGLLGTSNSLINDTETVVLANLAAGTYKVLVYGNNIAYPGVTYSLAIMRAQPCTPTYPTNTRSTAVTYPTQGIVNAVLCGTSPDAVNYFSYLVAEEQDLLNISLWFEHNNGNLDLVFYSDSGAVIQSATSKTSNEVILATNVEAGKYYIAVQEKSNILSNGTVYTMMVTDALSEATPRFGVGLIFSAGCAFWTTLFSQA